MEKFEEILGNYEEKTKPLREKKEMIEAQITEIRNYKLDSTTLLRHKVLSRRLEESIIDGDEKKAQVLRGELAEIDRVSGEIKKAKEQIPVLENEIKTIDTEIFSIGKSLQNEAIPVVRERWHDKLIEAVDFIDGASQSLNEFKREIGDTGLGGPDYLFKVNLLQSRELVLRLQKWINLPGHE